MAARELAKSIVNIFVFVYLYYYLYHKLHAMVKTARWKVNITIAFLKPLCLNSITKQQKQIGHKHMDMPASEVESVTLSDVLGLATWERQRSNEELQNFVNSRHALLPHLDEIE